MDAAKSSRKEGKGHHQERRSYNRSKENIPISNKNIPSKTLILDNGGYTMKIGYSHAETPVNIPNCIMKTKSDRRRAFIGDQIADCRSLSGLSFTRPHEKGYITKCDVQKVIWDYTFKKYPIVDSTVLMTQPVYNFRSIQEYTDEVFFEEYDIGRLFRATGTDYSYYNYIKQFKEGNTPTVVIDTGFSFTHIVPYINGKKYAKGIIRLELGGKILTNYLKDVLSLRQIRVMEETHVINQLKEESCYMSTENFLSDMQRTKATNEILQNYVLPDFQNIYRAYIEENITKELVEKYQILRLNNERITIPEIMMQPSIITGFKVAGLAESLYKSINRCPVQYQGHLSNNILFTGGNSLFAGFRDRLEKETRIFLPCEYKLNIHQPDDALNYSWFGGKAMSEDPELKYNVVTKRQYEEEGSSYIHEKFNQYCQLEEKKPEEESETFSYLNYWKNKGFDIFGKDPTKLVKDPQVKFILEGDNIEQFDGKYVTIEFELKPPEEENVKIEVEDKKKKAGKDNSKRNRKKRTRAPAPKAVSRSMPTATTESIPAASGSRILTLDASQIPNRTSLAAPVQVNSTEQPLNLVLPKHTQISPKMCTLIPSTSIQQQGQFPQHITLGSSSDHLSGVGIVPSTSSAKKVGAPRRVLNNTVIVPHHLLSSQNTNFKLLPIRPGSKEENIFITKKPQ